VTPGRVRSISLVPADPPAVPDAVAAVLNADWVVFGPGSWFTPYCPTCWYRRWLGRWKDAGA